MIFEELKLAGSFLIRPEKLEDDRGFFALTWSVEQFARHGLETRLVECNISFNRRPGTLRGMHYQAAPREQAKVVRCTAGAIYDCIIDLRAGSPTFKQWTAAELTADNRQMLYVPKGFAHGFQTLQDNSEVFYQMSDIYVPECGRGVRWDDPAFNIHWPQPASVMAKRDEAYPDFVG